MILNNAKNIRYGLVQVKKILRGASLVWNYITFLLAEFKARVLADGGTFEAESCFNIDSDTYENASLIITPNGFKASVLYGFKGADLDVIRATSATRVNISGVIESVGNNVPRLDYSNGSCPTILVEPQRTNVTVQSQTFNISPWSSSGLSILPNTILSPSGLLDATKILESDLNETHRVSQFTSDTSARVNSIFAKAGERSRFILWAGASGYMFDLISLTVTPGNNSASITDTKIEPYGNGWYRCSIVASAGPNNGFSITIMDNFTSPLSPSPSYQGDGVSGLYIWGAQRENNSINTTSYIPTTTAAVTRNADVISKAGISSLIGQTEGTIFIELNNTYDINADTIFDLSNTNLNYIRLNRLLGNRLQLLINVSGVLTVNIFNNINTNIEPLKKIAIGYANNNISMYVNGVLIGSNTSTAIPLLSDLRLGSRNTNTNFLNDKIKLFFLTKTRISNLQLQELSTL